MSFEDDLYDWQQLPIVDTPRPEREDWIHDTWRCPELRQVRDTVRRRAGDPRRSVRQLRPARLLCPGRPELSIAGARRRPPRRHVAGEVYRLPRLDLVLSFVTTGWEEGDTWETTEIEDVLDPDTGETGMREARTRPPRPLPRLDDVYAPLVDAPASEADEASVSKFARHVELHCPCQRMVIPLQWVHDQVKAGRATILIPASMTSR